MNLQITQDQRYCSFGDGLVYLFVTCDINTHPNPCKMCDLYHRNGVSDESVKCYAVPCQKLHRWDKMDGFWHLSQDVDYQQFMEMLKNGG